MRAEPVTGRRLMAAGLVLSSLVVGLQALVVLGFVSHSYTLWWKAGTASITAGIPTAEVMLGMSAVAVGFCLWAYDRLLRAGSRWRYAALVMGQIGLSGMLVFGGMVASGLVQLVHR